MRPLILSPLFASVEGLPFVGSKTAARLQKFGKPRVLDLLWAFPTDLEKRIFYIKIRESLPGNLVSCEVRILRHVPPSRPSQPYQVVCEQAQDLISLVFFHAQKPYLEQRLPIGATRLVCGRLEKTVTGFQIVHPDYIGDTSARVDWEGVFPIYGLTAGISQNNYRKIMKSALKRLPSLPEWLPVETIKKRQWPLWKEAMIKSHQPEEESDLLLNSPHRERLAFDELLAYQIGLSLCRKKALRKKGQKFDGSNLLEQKVRKALPFHLTIAQEEVLKTLSTELKSPVAMMRLLQGDVGSGKTIVALMAMLQVVEAGGQCALLAPTEILAQQHYETFRSFLKDLNVRVGLLLGKTTSKEKESLRQHLENGSFHIAIGTHALLEENIKFKQLGFVVIDEQHRFGVEQRQRLVEKAEGVNVLVMSATPIPRSLALTLYGDLDVSLLKEKPKDRLPIQTKVLSLERLPEVHEALKRAVVEGQKIYWVCPLIEESEALDLGHTEARVKILRSFLGEDKVAWMHGRMSAEEKEKAIYNFKEGSGAVLVSTTVIEVGIHIPEASIMIIEHAERFGLAQLHQLRGRVGRGHKPSTCLLLYGKKISAVGKKRLEIMRSTEDGFLIAEEDLKLRGAGDLLGTKQSGVPDFKIASLEDHGHLLPEAYCLGREMVEKINIKENLSLELFISLFSLKYQKNGD